MVLDSSNFMGRGGMKIRIWIWVSIGWVWIGIGMRWIESWMIMDRQTGMDRDMDGSAYG